MSDTHNTGSMKYIWESDFKDEMMMDDDDVMILRRRPHSVQNNISEICASGRFCELSVNCRLLTP